MRKFKEKFISFPVNTSYKDNGFGQPDL